MRRQGPDPCGSRFGGRNRLPGASGADRRLRGLRKEDCSPGAEGPGRTHPRNRHAGPGSEPSVRSAGARVIRGRAKESSRENLPRWRGSPPSRSSGPAIRFLGRAAASADPAAVLPATTTLLLRHLSSDPCRPAEASTPAALKQRSHEPRRHSLEAPRARQPRAWLPCEISVHKAAKAAQLIPSFLHRAIVIARPRKRGARR
jgi:hypothetical protein